MNAFAVALAPILFLIMVGFAIRRTHFIPDDSWAGMEKLTYYILLPALLVRTLARQSLEGSPWPSMLIVIIGSLILSVGVLVIFHRLRKTFSDATFTSIFQGGVRFNTYISLSVAQGLYGSQGLAMATVAAGFMIVLINILCISAFMLWGTPGNRGIRPFIRGVLVNPLIIACAIGWFLSLSGIGLPGVSENILEVLGRAALPFGLLAVGAALKPEMVKGHVEAVSVASLVQFVMKPVSVFLLVSITGLSGMPAWALFLSFMTPTATSSYILARQLGGDSETMASIITFQTLAAFIFMPVLGVIFLG